MIQYCRSRAYSASERDGWPSIQESHHQGVKAYAGAESGYIYISGKKKVIYPTEIRSTQLLRFHHHTNLELLSGLVWDEVEICL